ncbi:MAG: primosomal protein N' [Dysgonamonadaceae bacterium]|jgi:primosomal protein N' (replication factor Y)|nr:primosomal protein N' [Dysgonamonadaceae bacterium]
MYVDVILPVPLGGTYTYTVPPEMQDKIKTGTLVRVQFGKARYYTGIVANIKQIPPENTANIKPVTALETETPVALPVQIKFWQWIAEYCICPLGTVFHAAIPSRNQKTYKRNFAPDKQIETQPQDPLTPVLQKTAEDITNSFKTKNVVLLHSETAAGKTEIYINLINNSLNDGKQALYLLPEIMMTEQITKHLKHIFGDKLLIYHSGIINRKRIRIWDRMLATNEPVVVLGVRSSIFLPFQNLGLVIVDEEHESGYKQQESAPRYNARNAAIVLAKLHDAKTILGSATPSLESFYNSETGKYAYVCQKAQNTEPEHSAITVVDIKDLRRKKIMKSLFSPLLTEKIKETLDNGKQVILFQNRRGFSQSLTCKVCDWTPRCRFCDIPLKWHKQNNRLTCHYCGRIYTIPSKCPECNSDELQPRGFGTEKIEEQIKILFPSVEIARMDSDTTKNMSETKAIISDFESGKTQILIGTMMIVKNIDLKNVTLAGILNTDMLINQPDFRAHERTFQIITQISGITRDHIPPVETILQTSTPDSPLFTAILNHDYRMMAKTEMEERLLFHYPPFYRILIIDFRHEDENTVRNASIYFADRLRSKITVPNYFIGPDKPSVGKTDGVHIRRLLLKIHTGSSLNSIRFSISLAHSALIRNKTIKHVTITFNMDPV